VSLHYAPCSAPHSELLLSQRGELANFAGACMTCSTDGFWYEHSNCKTCKDCKTCKRSPYGGCNKVGKTTTTKKKVACTPTEDPTMPKGFVKNCLDGQPPSIKGKKSTRCWWTYVPDAIKKTTTGKVPLVVDMHGGGGCAGHQVAFSGFKERSDALGAAGFIVAFPQASLHEGSAQWGICGSDCAAVNQIQMNSGSGKKTAAADDITFLSNMLSYIVKSQSVENPSKNRVDAERIYMTGFSMGVSAARLPPLTLFDGLGFAATHALMLLSVAAAVHDVTSFRS
jgi:hypothetical protein